MAVIQMSHAKGEVAPNTFADIIWVRQQWNSLLEKYGEVSILVFNQEVIGHGDSYASAIADAEAKLVNVDATLTPIHERLRSRLTLHRTYRIKSIVSKEIREIMAWRLYS